MHCCRRSAGRPALNLAMDSHEQGVLERYGVEMIGAKLRVDQEGRGPRPVQGGDAAASASTCRAAAMRAACEDATRIRKQIGFPGDHPAALHAGRQRRRNIAYNREEFEEVVQAGLAISPVHEVLIEESMLGWKEYEMEVMRDHKDNVVIICSIENFDPDGRAHRRLDHRGAGANADRQRISAHARRRRCASSARSASKPADRTSSSPSIPKNGRMVVIEMNPRVSRSSALASKATGFPIAKIAAKLAVGYTLDEIPQRHHARNAGLLRADDRLRRDQDPALRLREISPGRRPA